jgi:hypothetical protein
MRVAKIALTFLIIALLLNAVNSPVRAQEIKPTEFDLEVSTVKYERIEIGSTIVKGKV